MLYKTNSCTMFSNSFSSKHYINIDAFENHFFRYSEAKVRQFELIFWTHQKITIENRDSTRSVFTATALMNNNVCGEQRAFVDKSMFADHKNVRFLLFEEYFNKIDFA